MKKLLILSLILLVGLSLFPSQSVDKMFQTRFDSKPELSYEEAAQIATYLDSLTDKLEDKKLPVLDKDIIMLVMEITPNFEYEGAIDSPRYPTLAELKFFPDGQSHNHVLGRSNCEGFVINVRYANPYSTLYQDTDWIQTVVHEMVHVQQGQYCQVYSRENIENTAEIVSWEVMAAQVNKGNAVFLYPLLSSLKGRAMSVAWLTAMDENKMPEFETLKLKLANTPAEISSWEKAKRQWSGNMPELRFVLDAYGKQPFERLIAALQGTYAVEGLALPPTQHERTHMPEDRIFRVDDLAYFLLNVEMIVEDRR